MKQLAESDYFRVTYTSKIRVNEQANCMFLTEKKRAILYLHSVTAFLHS